jgi:hypothetical protein
MKAEYVDVRGAVVYSETWAVQDGELTHRYARQI